MVKNHFETNQAKAQIQSHSEHRECVHSYDVKIVNLFTKLFVVPDIKRIDQSPNCGHFMLFIQTIAPPNAIFTREIETFYASLDKWHCQQFIVVYVNVSVSYLCITNDRPGKKIHLICFIACVSLEDVSSYFFLNTNW